MHIADNNISRVHTCYLNDHIEVTNNQHYSVICFFSVVGPINSLKFTARIQLLTPDIFGAT